MSIFLLYYIRKKVTRTLYQSSKKHIKVPKGRHADLYLNIDNGSHINKTEYEKLSLPTNTSSHINIWYMHKYDNAKVIIYYHGTNCNISYRKYMLEICDILRVNIVLVDYRGFGKSEGKANSDNILRDADAVYNFVAKYHQPHKIIIWGESLGGTPAIHNASKRPICGLILLSTFTFFHSIIKGNYLLYYLARTVTADINKNTNNLKMIGKTNCRVLIFHSTDDKLIDYGDAIQLIEAVPHTNKKLVNIRGDHDKPQFTEENFRDLVEFLGLRNVSHSDILKILDIVDNISEVVHEEMTSSNA